MHGPVKEKASLIQIMAAAFPSFSQPTSPGAIKSRIATAEQFKVEGNGCYRKRDYKKAIGKYHRALLQLKNIDGQDFQGMLQGITGIAGNGTKVSLPEEITEQVNQLELSCYNNLAACLLHDTNPKYDKIIKYCGAVLKHNEHNTKAWYRQGVALYHIRDYEGARKCLNTAREHMPKDPDVLRYLHLSEVAISKQLEAEKRRCQGLFRKMAEEDSSD